MLRGRDFIRLSAWGPAEDNIPGSASKKRKSASRIIKAPNKTAAARAHSVDPVTRALGSKIREKRERSGISLRGLARALRLSPSLLSQIERGRLSPSVGTLWSAVTELGISVDSLLAEAGGDGNFEQSASVSAKLTPVQRHGQRKRIRLAGGVTWERLSSGPEPTVDFILETYEPGAVSSPDRAMHRHGGREYLYVVSGRLGMAIDFEEYELGPGDSMSYSSERPHRGWTIGNRPAILIWVMVHPTNQPEPAPSQTDPGADAPH